MAATFAKFKLRLVLTTFLFVIFRNLVSDGMEHGSTIWFETRSLFRPTF